MNEFETGTKNSDFENNFPAIDKVLKILENRYHKDSSHVIIPYNIDKKCIYKGIASKVLQKCEVKFSKVKENINETQH